MSRNCLLFCVLALNFPSARADDVIINEIMYHPSSENRAEEYIELYNRGATAVDLTGWRFSSGVQFTFPASSLAPGAYLVVAADLTAFHAKYPAVGSVIGGWQGSLGNSDEDIDLDDATGKRVDSVHYASQGDWAVRMRGPLDNNHRGWIWFAGHDGQGKSLELINPLFSNNYGQNWAASLNNQGTPGQVNSIQRPNIAPVIRDVSHFPAVPTSSDSVAIVARVNDEHTNGLAVTLHHRLDGGGGFSATQMFDDGQHGDGAAGDEFYGAVLPARANRTVVEFYVEARDLENNTRTWPAPIQPENTQSANLLYQVNDSAYSGAQPQYFLIMTEVERAELDYIGDTLPDAKSDAAMNGTFISIDEQGINIRYTVGIRNRGHGSRTARPNNYHVQFPNDTRWEGLRALNLNTQFTHAQLVGSEILKRSGVVAADARPVQVRVNGVNLAQPGSPQFGSYIAVEAVNSDYADNHFSGDPNGNLYRGVAADNPPAEADLYYRGSNPDAYRNTYFKETNESEDDWSDLIELTRVFSETPSNAYSSEIRRVLDPNNWLRYFAINALFDNNESGIYMGYGDDYAMYRGLNNTRFVMVAHDNDTIMGQGAEPGSAGASIFRATALENIGHFLRGPEFGPLYYAHLRGLIRSTFSNEAVNQLLDDLLLSWVPGSTIDAMYNFAVARNDYVLGQLPHTIPIDQTWKYEQSGTDLGTAWREIGYNDSAWPSGPALLYNESASLPAPKRTRLNLGATTYYFRTHFQVNSNFLTAGTQLRIELNTVIDDGAVFYLNGTEIFRIGMPDGPVNYSTLSPRAIGDAISEGPFLVSASAIVAGDNVLAVEVHQTDPTSSDIVFGSALDLLILPDTPTYSPVVLNEVLAYNLNLAEGDGSHPDRVELYNRGDEDFDLSDASLTDNDSLPRKWVFPSPTVIPAHGFLVVRCDGTLPASASNTGFGLKRSGDDLYLFDKPAKGGAMMDSIHFGLQPPDFSIGRIPSGTGDDWALTQPTFGGANLAAPLGSAFGLRINEWMADPAEGDDWFELYNPGSSAVALGGLFLSDNLNNHTESRIPDRSYIGVGPGAFLKFEADSNPGKGADHANFKLSGSGETIALFTDTGALLDSVTFGPQQADVSEGRFPDGTASIVAFPGSATPEAANHFGMRISISVQGQTVHIGFRALAGQTYTVQFRDSMSTGSWLRLRDVSAQPIDTDIDVLDTIFAGFKNRFYRLVSPAQP